MRVKAFVPVIVFILLLALLLTATQASSMPMESASLAASPETWYDFQPSGWMTSNLVTCEVEVYNPSGFIDDARYTYSTDSGMTWSGELPGIQITVIDATRRRLTVASLSLPDSVTPNQNQIQFSILDPLGLKLWSPVYSVRVDTVTPTSVVSTSGCYNVAWPGQITGTARDVGSGVNRVEITLQDSSGWYYNGSSWQPTQAWLLVAGTDNWSYSIVLAQGIYTVRSRATDVAGNVQTVPNQQTFVYDMTAPQSNVEIAGCFNGIETWPGIVYGSASDLVSGLASVQINIQRASDGFYYDGLSWGPTQKWITASGTTSWFLPFTPPVETTYTVKSRAADGCGNVQSPPGEGSFTYDTTAPQSTVGITGCVNASSVWPGVLSGSASDAVSGVANVEITVQRASDNFYYYGGALWGPSLRWITVTGTTAWSLPFIPPMETTYTIQSRATDHCDNVQTAYGRGTFSYDVTLPTSAVATAGSFNAWSGVITGTAIDTMSGVASVQATVQRAADSFYYYGGSSWGSTLRWITVTGTTIWSLPFTPPMETTYTVRSKATDFCGNAQSEYGQAVFTYDVTAPSPPSNLSVVPIDWTRVNSFTLTWNNPVDVSGVARAYYKWNTEPSSNNDQSVGSPVSSTGIHSLNLMVPVQGAHQLYLWLGDVAGNVNYQNRNVTATRAFKYDAVPPLTSITNVSGTQGCAGWYTSTVQVTSSASDVNPDPGTINETSGISATLWRKDGGSWQRIATSMTATFAITGDGLHTVEYYSADRAGNQETPKVLSPQIKIDSTPPTTHAPSYTGTMGRNGWYTSTVLASLSAVDATSGVSATFHQVDTGAWAADVGSTASFVVADDGVHAIHYYAVDIACNQEIVQAVATPLKIDKTAPSTSYQVEGQRGDGVWFLATPVTVTLSPSDAITGVQTSGVDNLRYRVDGGSWQQRSGTATFTLVSEGAHTIEYYATDLAGNVEPTRVLTVGIDFHAPPAIPYVPIVSPNSWTKNNCFTITWDANPADLSGIGGAYYNFTEPISSTDGTLVRGDNITSIPCVQVPDELGDGAHTVYIWLRDKAGNSDHRTRREPMVRLDRTPPIVVSRVTGNECGTAGWYNSCITVTFVATDNVPSGMVGGVISYHVLGGGGWIAGGSYCECRDGRYTVEYRAMDAAGNVGNIVTTTVKLDRTAPSAPINMRVEPADWSKDNVFTINWLNPADLSGIAGVYYKLGSLPTSCTDGIYVDGNRSSLQVTATTEGETLIYVWLVDKACNCDHLNRATTTLKYDRTPPVTVFFPSGSLGGDGWYISAVRIVLNCQDGGPGVGSGCATSYYRVGDGSWQSGTSFLIDADGIITSSYYSVDMAGNVESTRTNSVKIDRVPPSSYAYADSYSQSTSFTVYWDGNDASSGVAAFDVQYRIGASGVWQNWLINVNPLHKSELFTSAERGLTYYFRTRARDKAGNEEPYPSMPDTYVAVDPLLNGDFEHGNGNLTGWDRSGPCQPMLIVTQSYSGGSTHAVVLGCPDVKDGVPFGASMICQTVNVPNAQTMPAPMLRFRYRIFTYDVVWGQQTKKFYDSFNVGLSAPGQIAPTYVYTDGNWTQDYGNLKDLGWRVGTVDLRPYAGRTLNICLANVTREDTSYNTWTLVDDVQMVNLEYRLYLPVALRSASASGLAAAKAGFGSTRPGSEAAERLR